MSKISVTAASRVGCVRSNNEDMILAYNKLVRSDAHATTFVTDNTDRFVIALADGMGGHNGGEVASELTLSNLQFFINDLPKGLNIGDFNEMMVVWLNSINQIMTSKGHADPNLSEMGTTLVGIIYYGGKYFWINCGDSRLYRFRNGLLTQLSTDHSLNRILGEKRHSNVITNCIGAGCKNSYLDIYEFTDDIFSDDVYMLCSDGLTDMIEDEHIEKMLAGGADANLLCDAAVEAGGYDNVSVCVLKIDE